MGGAGDAAGRSRIILSALAAVVTLALLSAPVASGQESLAASCAPTLNTYEGTPSGTWLLAQPFVSQLSGTLTRAELELRDLSGAGDWIVQIRAAQPSTTYPGELEPTAVVLASETLPDATFVTEGGDSRVSVVFATPAAVVAGGGYAISVTRPAATGANDLAVGAHSPTTECDHRTYVSTTSAGTTWSASGTDLIFAAFVTTPPANPPTTPADSNNPPPANPPTTGTPASCKGQQATLVGTESADDIVGTAGRDVIAALGGNDTVSGLAGKDLICGGAGKDTLKGGPGSDTLLGESGKDKLKGGGAKDVCKGGKGNDSGKCEVEKSF